MELSASVPVTMLATCQVGMFEHPSVLESQPLMDGVQRDSEHKSPSGPQFWRVSLYSHVLSNTKGVPLRVIQ